MLCFYTRKITCTNSFPNTFDIEKNSSSLSGF